MQRQVKKYISIRDEIYLILKGYSLMFGIPASRIAEYLCLSFLGDEDGQVLDHREMKF